jgi:hypothetical protein
MCEALHQAFFAKLAPLAMRVQAARELADDLLLERGSLDIAAVTTLTARIEALGHACATDPLSFAGQAAVEVLGALDTELATVSARLAGLAAVRDGWAEQLRELAALLQEIGTLREQEEQARQRAQELIANPGLVAPPDRLPVLRSRLNALTAHAGWPARVIALAELRATADDAAGELRAACARASGLLDRRTELCGRFKAYRAKAARLGLAEHPEALALDERIRQLLWTRPCDLAAATRVLAKYLRLAGCSSPGKST